MAQTFTKGTKTVHTTEEDIFTPITDTKYQGLYIFHSLIDTNDIHVRVWIWNDTLAQYEIMEPLTQIGETLDTCKYIPLLPVRRFKVTIFRTAGVGADVDYDIQFDIVTQTG